jgi:hypothetical protein
LVLLSFTVALAQFTALANIAAPAHTASAGGCCGF